MIYEDGKASVPQAAPPVADDTPTSQSLPQSTAPRPASGSSYAVQSGVPTKRFDRPVPIGVSSINQTDVCAAGTLGCRCVDRAGNQYALSNCHVYGEENKGTIGDPVCQPSQLEVACDVRPNDVIGTLKDFHRIQFFSTPTAAGFEFAPINTMDAAVALCPVGMVDVRTPLVGYGIPSRSPQENLFIGMKVQKYGRTTVFTKGQVFSLNVESLINYGAAGYARFR